MTTYKRKLIEVALPLEAINVASAHEKMPGIGPHPRGVHMWWARRPLAACRAVLFGSLVDDPSSDPDRFPTPKAVEDERTRLFGIIERLVRWENTTNEAVLEEARAEIRRSTGGNPPPVLDPFCGGGSIPLEAQRLGLVAYASDLNPVAVLITKALIEIPPKFANRRPVHPDARGGLGSTGAWEGATGLAEDVRRYGERMNEEANRRIGHLYPRARLPKEHGGGETTVIAWLWARTVACPNPACGAQMPIVRSFALTTKKGKETWVEPVVNRAARSVEFEIRSGAIPSLALNGTATVAAGGKKVRATFSCCVCGVGIAGGEYIDDEAGAGRMNATLLAVVADGRRGRVYLPPGQVTTEATNRAVEMLPALASTMKLPTEPARGTFASNAQGRIYGFRQFKDYFTPRQLIALTTFCDLVGEVRDGILRDAIAAGLPDDGTRLADGGTGAPAYADAVATYLGFAVDRCADFNNTLCRWVPSNEKVMNVFARQALSMTWDYAEANISASVVGGLEPSVKYVADCVELLPATVPGVAAQVDAATRWQAPSSQPVLISSDPPYYNNVGYSDLSDFFYVWLRRSLGSVYPDVFDTVLTPKSAELVATPYRFEGNQTRADIHFERGLGAAFARMREVADSTVPVTIYYAFKQAESDGEGTSTASTSTGWETMLEALLAAGFAIGGTWPIRSEQSERIVASGTNALASSIVLVCRPRQVDAGITTRKDFVAALKREMPAPLRTLQHGNIAPVDLAQASIGPGMAVFSRFAKVLEPDGAPMRIRTALALINQVLDAILAEQEGEFDSDTRWAIAWYEQYGLADGPSGQAILLTQAKNTSLDGLERAGIVVSGKGRVRLLARIGYSDEWDPATDTRLPVWEATQRLIRALLMGGGEVLAADILARLGGIGDVARDLAYRLYQVAERKGWTEEARTYNALVVAWPDLARRAQGRRDEGPSQGDLGLG